jgi:hypothetical protein
MPPKWPQDLLDWIIRVVAQHNPEGPGAQTYQRFRLYRTGMTVREYASRCELEAADHGPQFALYDLLWGVVYKASMEMS